MVLVPPHWKFRDEESQGIPERPGMVYVYAGSTEREENAQTWPFIRLDPAPACAHEGPPLPLPC